MTGDLNDGAGLNNGAHLSHGARRDHWPGLFPRPPEGDTDPRFSVGLIHDLTGVLVNHGYPDLTEWPARGPVELRQHLFRFLCGPSQRGQP